MKSKFLKAGTSLVMATLCVFGVFGCAGAKETKLEDYKHVSSGKELVELINDENSPSSIILDNDITLDQSLEIQRSVELDLNGFVLSMANCMDSVIIGKATLKTEAAKQINNVYEMLDINVTIKNGTIKAKDGRNAANGYSTYCMTLRNIRKQHPNGFDGMDGGTAILVISGTINLTDVNVYGGNGGNGGNGASQKDIVIPSKSGNGGNGGNGGCAISICGAGMRYPTYNFTNIVAIGGNGGNAGKPGIALSENKINFSGNVGLGGFAIVHPSCGVMTKYYENCQNGVNGSL